MSRVLTTLGALAAAAGLEFGLLHADAFKAVGGYVQPAEAFLYSVIWAAVPFLAAIFVLAIATVRRAVKRILVPLLLVAATGPAFALLAFLQNNSDSSNHVLIAGFGLQCLEALLAAVLLALPPNRAFENGRSPAARAAQRER